VNDWFSCYGGGNIDPALAGTGCGELGFIGITGTFGEARFLNGEAFPNVHTIQVGFYQGSDISEGQWKRVPGDTYFPQEIDRLGRNVGPVSIKNPLLIGDDYCIDTANLATFQYTGGEVSDVDPKTGAIEYYEPLSYSTDITSLVEEAGTCEAPDARTYDLGTLQYCEIAYASDENNQHEYEADWPIDRPFFIGDLAENGEYDASVAVDVQLDIPDEGIENLPIRLPEYAMFRGDLGFSGGSTPYWTLTTLESCFDSNGDGSATLDEDAITFSWVPSSVKSEDVVGGQVKAMQTYVPVSISELRVGWFGGENFPRARACACPTTPTTTRPRVGRPSRIPNWVLYQFPTIDSSWGYQTPAGAVRASRARPTGRWRATTSATSRSRRTASPSTRSHAKGDVVLAYATGDFGSSTGRTRSTPASAATASTPTATAGSTTTIPIATTAERGRLGDGPVLVQRRHRQRRRRRRGLRRTTTAATASTPSRTATTTRTTTTTASPTRTTVSARRRASGRSSVRTCRGGSAATGSTTTRTAGPTSTTRRARAARRPRTTDSGRISSATTASTTTATATSTRAIRCAGSTARTGRRSAQLRAGRRLRRRGRQRRRRLTSTETIRAASSRRSRAKATRRRSGRPPDDEAVLRRDRQRQRRLHRRARPACWNDKGEPDGNLDDEASDAF
jgi:hypothetical protein